MQDCADFGSLRMDQRFEIMNEELASVCSKFAHGKVNIFIKKVCLRNIRNNKAFAKSVFYTRILLCESTMNLHGIRLDFQLVK